MRRPGIDFSREPRITEQAHAEKRNINNLVARYGPNGVPQVGGAQYMDIPDGVDFREAQDQINRMNQNFSQLDSRTRGMFNNDPVEFMEFCQDEKNLPELRRLGLANDVPEGNDKQELKPDVGKNLSKDSTDKEGAE